MLVTGTDCACIVASTDILFTNAIWLDEILTEGKYSGPYDGTQLWDDQFYNTIKKHSLKFVTGDTQKFTSIEALAEANTPVYIYLFGIDGTISWESASIIRTERVREIKSREVDALQIEVKKSGLNLDIRVRKNLLASAIATGTNISGITIESGLTFVSTTPNGSFTTATGNIFKLTKTVSDGLVYHKAQVDQKFPARKNHPVSVRFNTYPGTGNSDGNPGLILTGYDGSGVSTETAVIGNGALITGEIKGTYLFANSSTRYFKLSFAADEYNSINEFDNIVLAYGGPIPSFTDY